MTEYRMRVKGPSPRWHAIVVGYEHCQAYSNDRDSAIESAKRQLADYIAMRESEIEEFSFAL